MGVDGSNDSLQLLDHFGSLYTMEDYRTNGYQVYFNSSWMANSRLTLHSSLLYNWSQAELELVDMPHVTEEVEEQLHHQDFTFEEMHTYSDLKYHYVNVQLGFDYQLTPRIAWMFNMDYSHLTADEEYVFGDEDGSMFITRTGVKIDF
ncbi:hypothetical protein GF356_05345 [candidate division GN15 bacterium]|nr:hypothetical protein [candidate division GN15 bacterium]